MATLLDEIFDGDSWRSVTSPDFEQRADQAVERLKELTAAQWATYIRMLGENNATVYALLHLTNHDKGRDLMKGCLWKICPDGGFFVRRSDHPDQRLLIQPEADLTPLRDWVLSRLRVGGLRWSQLEEFLREELWREAQLNDVVRQLRTERLIDATEFSGRFSRKADPLLTIRSSSSR